MSLAMPFAFARGFAGLSNAQTISATAMIMKVVPVKRSGLSILRILGGASE
jgi:hypothetical protein